MIGCIIFLLFAMWRNIVWEIRAARDWVSMGCHAAPCEAAYRWQVVGFVIFYITAFLSIVGAWS